MGNYTYYQHNTDGSGHRGHATTVTSAGARGPGPRSRTVVIDGHPAHAYLPRDVGYAEVPIVFRGDSGFAIPALYDYLDEQQISYAIGLATNERLTRIAAPLLDEAHTQATELGEKVQLFGETRYAAGTWAHERRVVYKAEWLAKGGNVRLVVTNQAAAPEVLYHRYVQRSGGPELWIKDLKNACFADRLNRGSS